MSLPRRRWSYNLDLVRSDPAAALELMKLALSSPESFRKRVASEEPAGAESGLAGRLRAWVRG